MTKTRSEKRREGPAAWNGGRVRAVRRMSEYILVILAMLMLVPPAAADQASP